MKPKIINSKLSLLGDDVLGITLWPFILLKFDKIDKWDLEETINHEKIHIAQQVELLVIFFYLWYGIEWLVKFFKYGKKSYYHISFEQEAYKFESNLEYLKKRKRFSFVKFIF